MCYPGDWGAEMGEWEAQVAENLGAQPKTPLWLLQNHLLRVCTMLLLPAQTARVSVPMTIYSQIGFVKLRPAYNENNCSFQLSKKNKNKKHHLTAF